MSLRLTKNNENQERGFSDEGNTGILACGKDEGNTGILACGKKGQMDIETDIYTGAMVLS